MGGPLSAGDVWLARHGRHEGRVWVEAPMEPPEQLQEFADVLDRVNRGVFGRRVARKRGFASAGELVVWLRREREM
eukprot:14534576-Alexandrium_andersonii.AAC.1